MEGFDKNWRRSGDRASLQTLTILRYEIPWKAVNYGVNWHQSILSIEIHCYSNVWRSICTAWRVLMPSWCDYHSIALVLGKILRTIDCVYLQLPGGNSHLAELKVSQSEQWSIIYHMTSVAYAFSTARRVGSRVGWLHSWDNSVYCPWRYSGTRSLEKRSIMGLTAIRLNSD